MSFAVLTSKERCHSVRVNNKQHFSRKGLPLIEVITPAAETLQDVGSRLQPSYSHNTFEPFYFYVNPLRRVYRLVYTATK